MRLLRRPRVPTAAPTVEGRSPAIPMLSKIGAAGFGPATSCAQGRRATRLRYAPEAAESAGTSLAVSENARL